VCGTLASHPPELPADCRAGRQELARAIALRFAGAVTKRPWPIVAARYLNHAEGAVLILIGVVLVVLAVLLLWTSGVSMIDAVRDNTIGHKAIEILNSVLLVMMTMEIVYTVAISLESHSLVAEPFLIIGTIAAIRRMLVITATSTETEHSPDIFHNTLVELGLLGATVIALSIAIWMLRHSQTLRTRSAPPATEAPREDQEPQGHRPGHAGVG
jgi:phosphate starvation-inducible membrane PsiE